MLKAAFAPPLQFKAGIRICSPPGNGRGDFEGFAEGGVPALVQGKRIIFRAGQELAVSRRVGPVR